MSRFQMLSLPFLALREILKCFSPIELFDLSQCSARTAQKIKLIGSKLFKLDVCLVDNYVEVNGELFEVPKIDDHLWQTRFIQRYMSQGLSLRRRKTFLCDDADAGLQTIFFQLSELFNCPVHSLSSDRSVPREHFNTVIRFIASRQKVIQDLSVSARDLINEDVKFVLENIKVIGALVVDPIQSPPTQPSYQLGTRNPEHQMNNVLTDYQRYSPQRNQQMNGNPNGGYQQVDYSRGNGYHNNGQPMNGPTRNHQSMRQNQSSYPGTYQPQNIVQQQQQQPARHHQQCNQQHQRAPLGGGQGQNVYEARNARFNHPPPILNHTIYTGIIMSVLYEHSCTTSYLPVHELRHAVEVEGIPPYVDPVMFILLELRGKAEYNPETGFFRIF